MALPAPLELLNSIFITLTTAPVFARPSSGKPPSNPFQTLPNSHRALLTTLHVLLPSTLLQAFDLLDRGLITRISLLNENECIEKHRSEFVPTSTTQIDAETVIKKHNNVNTEKSDFNIKSPTHTLYQVRSSHYRAKLSGRQNHSNIASHSPLSYTVYLDAWNCSCAAFTFSAFPVSESTSSPWSNIKNISDRDKLNNRRQKGEWVFGALHLEHDEMEFPPICKHLLACLFAEKWGDVLGSFVKEIQLGREEFAALACQE